MLEGDGNAVVWPETKRGILRDLKPVPPAFISFVPEGVWNYRVILAGQEYDPEDVLHFVLNPGSYYPWKGEGYRVALADVANNLKQAAATEKGFMSSKWKPSIIVKVDALTEEFLQPGGPQEALVGIYRYCAGWGALADTGGAVQRGTGTSPQPVGSGPGGFCAAG